MSDSEYSVIKSDVIKSFDCNSIRHEKDVCLRYFQQEAYSCKNLHFLYANKRTDLLANLHCLIIISYKLDLL